MTSSTGTLVLVFTLFAAATTFGKFEFSLRQISIRLLAACCAFASAAIVSWEPRALESSEIIEMLAVASLAIFSQNPTVILLSAVLGIMQSSTVSGSKAMLTAAFSLSATAAGLIVVAVIGRDPNLEGAIEVIRGRFSAAPK